MNKKEEEDVKMMITDLLIRINVIEDILKEKNITTEEEISKRVSELSDKMLEVISSEEGSFNADNVFSKNDEFNFPSLSASKIDKKDSN